jgi:hypothetical protein
MAMTYTPSIGLDANGQEVPVFDNGVFETSDGREVTTAYHQATEYNDYYGNEVEGFRHKYSELDPERYQQYEEDFVNQITSEDLFDGNYSNADEQYLRDIIGGTEQAKNALLAWGENHLNPQDWNEFRSAMNGDIEQMAQWIDWLNKEALENGFDASLYAATNDSAATTDGNTYEDVEEDDSYSADDEFAAQAFDHFGQDNYLQATAWAYENLSPEMIEEYDNAMDNAPYEVRAQYLERLMEMFYSAANSSSPDYYDEPPVAGVFSHF